MSIGFRVLVLLSLVAVASCEKEDAAIITEYKPDLTKVRVRVLNSTNTALDFGAPTGDFVGHNTNVLHGASRCIEMAPGGVIRVRDFATHAAVVTTPAPTAAYEAGKVYSLLVYNTANPTTVNVGSFVVGNLYTIASLGTTSTGTATAGTFVVGRSYTIVTVGTTNWVAIGAASNTVGITFTATGVGAGTGTASFATIPTDFVALGASSNTVGRTFVATGAGSPASNGNATSVPYAYLAWQSEAQNTPPADSGGFSVLNVNPTVTTSAATGIDVYLNAVAVAPAVEPPLALANRKAINVALGALTTYFPIPGRTSYQLRITRTGVTNATLINTTHTLLEGENSVMVLGIPSLTAATTQRVFSTGGC